MNDLQLIARLASLMVAALKAPLPDVHQLAVFAAVLGDAADGSADGTSDAQDGGCGGLPGTHASAAAPDAPSSHEPEPEGHGGISSGTGPLRHLAHGAA
jgi:hypothetical protein